MGEKVGDKVGEKVGEKYPENLNKTQSAIKKNLRTLKEMGLISRVGPAKEG